MYLLPNLWLATYLMLYPLCYSGVHDTMHLNLYTFVPVLHHLYGVYILTTSSSILLATPKWRIILLGWGSGCMMFGSRDGFWSIFYHVFHAVILRHGPFMCIAKEYFTHWFESMHMYFNWNIQPMKRTSYIKMKVIQINISTFGADTTCIFGLNFFKFIIQVI